MTTYVNKTPLDQKGLNPLQEGSSSSFGDRKTQGFSKHIDATAQENLLDVASQSPVVKRMAQFKAMAENSKATQAAMNFQTKANQSFVVNKSHQLQSQADTYSSQLNPIIQKKTNSTGLPDGLKSGIENLSGHSMDDVKVHYNSNKPAQLNAHAYAQGTNIHLGSGQEKHLPHEAWHVVQQKQGRVKPTMQMKGKINVNDNAGLEQEADTMGAKALENNSLTHSKELNKGTELHSDSPAQFTMLALHQRDRARVEHVGYTEDNYTTVGFEIDLLKTPVNSPLQGISHVILGKTAADYGLLDMKYLLETDAGNVLELVTPPYMIKRNDNGVLDAADLKLTMADLKSGFDATRGAMGGPAKNVTDSFNAINANFNIALAYQQIHFADDDHAPGEDGVIDETHMSTRIRGNSLGQFINKNEDTQKADLRITRGPTFSPQLNIFTTIDGYHGLDEATESRIGDDGPNFHGGDGHGITVAKTAFLNRLDGLLEGDRFDSSKAQLRHVLLVVEARRDALIAQKAVQGTIFENDNKSTAGVDAPAFNRNSGDASFVKDTGGVWLKTDITNYIMKALKYNGADIKRMGGLILRANAGFAGGVDGVYNEANAGWQKRVARLGKRLHLEGTNLDSGLGSNKADLLRDMKAEDEASWNTQTYSLSDKLLGLRHDTMLRERLVAIGQEALLDKNDSFEADRDADSWNMKAKVLVEVRNLKITGEEDGGELNTKIDDFLEAWNDAMGGDDD